MAKAASAQIGQSRYYHLNTDEYAICSCTERKRDAKCPYSYPSVTTVIDTWPKPWLGAWAAKEVASLAIDEIGNLQSMLANEGQKAVHDYLKGAPWRKRDAAAERGTAAHKAAEEGTALEDVPENARKRVAAYHRWLDDWQPEILWQEMTVFNHAPYWLIGPNPALRYAGTLDLIAKVGNDVWLIDLKAADAKHTHRLQLAAYRYANEMLVGDRRQLMPDIDRCAVLSLKDDGYAWLEVSAGQDEYQAFLTTAALARQVKALEVGDVGREVER